jgi:dihydroorotate dehydrogenase
MLSSISRKELACDALESFFGAPKLPVDLFGLHFDNPVGLAAGMDKEAVAVPVWPALGFGSVELGGVTWEPQPGNPPPRLFRAITDGALINRMGFNNPGAEAFAQTLSNWRTLGRWPDCPVGINLGKSKSVPLERAAEDYVRSFRVLKPHADFFVINVSSPNTPNLRKLQDKAALDEILAAVDGEGRGSRVEGSQPSSATRRLPLDTPILVKVAPDLSFEALDEILEVATARHLAGIVATNTTIERPQTGKPQLQRIYSETGGLSGRPLRERSTEVIRHLFRQMRGALPIIGVGGIFTAADAWEKIIAGASLVQIYTGLIYEGPGLAKAIVHGLLDRLEEAGLASLQEAVGIGSEAKPGAFA